MHGKRLPICYPISKDTMPMEISAVALTTGHADSWFLSILKELQMIKSKELMVGLYSLHVYRTSEMKGLLISRPSDNKYTLQDIEQATGERVALMYIEAMLDYQSRKKPSEVRVGRGKKEKEKLWVIASGGMHIDMNNEQYGWIIEHLSYDRREKKFVLGIEKYIKAPFRYDEIDFQVYRISGDEDFYIEDPGISFYDIVVQVGAWLFSKAANIKYLLPHLSSRLLKMGAKVVISDVTAKAEMVVRGKRKNKIVHKKLGTGKRLYISPTLSLSSLFIETKETPLSKCEVVVGNLSLGNTYLDKWFLTVSLKDNSARFAISMFNHQVKSAFRYLKNYTYTVHVPIEKPRNILSLPVSGIDDLYAVVRRMDAYQVTSYRLHLVYLPERMLEPPLSVWTYIPSYEMQEKNPVLWKYIRERTLSALP